MPIRFALALMRARRLLAQFGVESVGPQNIALVLLILFAVAFGSLALWSRYSGQADRGDRKTRAAIEQEALADERRRLLRKREFE